MPQKDIAHYVDERRLRFLIAAYGLIAVVGLADWWIESNVALGFLYFFPVIVLGALAPRWHILFVSVVCAVMREAFSPFTWSEGGSTRISMALLAYLGVGLTVSELFRNRRMEQQHMHRLEYESERRREAEQQLRVLIDSSPAAIIMLDERQTVLLANEAADRLLGLEPGSLRGQSLAAYLPDLTLVPAATEGSQFHTTMECRGYRKNGEVFLASVSFATYNTLSGPRLAAIVSDVSEGLREREEANLEQTMSSGRILIGAVSHEIRNFCAAIALVRNSLGHMPALADQPEFQALGTLVDGLERIASTELRKTASPDPAGVDLSALLDELRIIIEPPLRESGIEVRWEVAPHLPPVTADRQSLLQVFLNLIKNSERAVQDRPRRELALSAALERGLVVVRVRDSGPGVPIPDRLFRPFQAHAHAQSTGLGLYISRALVRAFQGELRHEPQTDGCCFAVELNPLRRSEDLIRGYRDDVHTDAPDRRPHAVS